MATATTKKTKARKTGTVEIDAVFCKGCEVCVHFCPQGCLALSGTINAGGYNTATCTNTDQCTGCAICALVCPEAAIEVYRA